MLGALTLRRDIAKLSTRAGQDFDAIWRRFDQAEAAAEALRDLLPQLVTTYGSAAATVAANWYDDYREQVAAPRSFGAAPIEASDRGTQALIGWAKTTATDDQTLRTLLLGGVQKRIADHSRYTITTSSFADPAARGWQRVGVGKCDFCQMLLGRGAVYTEDTADFPAHDNCNCGAEPAF